MSDLKDILTEALPFEINGKEYWFSKITLGIMADFETAMSMRKLQRALKALGPEATHAERAELISSYGSNAGLGDALASVYSAEGARLMLWLSLKANHPELIEDDVGRLITPGLLPEMQSLLDRLTDSGPLEEAGELAKNATAAREEAGQVSPRPSPKNTATTGKS